MVGEISSAELRDRRENGETIEVVDIRSPAGFRRGHIPGSVNVPFQQLPNQVESLAGADRIVTVCPHGKSSLQAAKLINSYEGIEDGTAVSLAGGLDEWDGDVVTADEGRDDEGPSAPF